LCPRSVDNLTCRTSFRASRAIAGLRSAIRPQPFLPPSGGERDALGGRGTSNFVVRARETCLTPGG
jgi:hypothetical protein